MPVPSAKGGHPFVPLADTDQVVCRSNVEFSIDFCSYEAIESLTDQWEWIAILDCDFVQASIVYAES